MYVYVYARAAMSCLAGLFLCVYPKPPKGEGDSISKKVIQKSASGCLCYIQTQFVRRLQPGARRQEEAEQQ
jgi:hypothetical protein